MKTRDSRGFGQLGVVWALTLVTAVCLLGCTDSAIDNASGSPIPPEASKPQGDGDLAPGDVINITYPGAPEMNLSQKIRADGRVSLPIIGEVRAGGRSLSSFQSYLHGRYKTNLQEPKVVVSVVSAAAAVYVSGAVNNPGKIPLDRPMTALEAVMEAGGPSQVANTRKVSVIRTVGGAHKRYNLDMTNALSGTASVFYLRPFDVIYVGQRLW